MLLVISITGNRLTQKSSHLHVWCQPFKFHSSLRANQHHGHFLTNRIVTNPLNVNQRQTSISLGSFFRHQDPSCNFVPSTSICSPITTSPTGWVRGWPGVEKLWCGPPISQGTTNGKNFWLASIDVPSPDILISSEVPRKKTSHANIMWHRELTLIQEENLINSKLQVLRQLATFKGD